VWTAPAEQSHIGRTRKVVCTVHVEQMGAQCIQGVEGLRGSRALVSGDLDASTPRMSCFPALKQKVKSMDLNREASNGESMRTSAIGGTYLWDEASSTMSSHASHAIELGGFGCSIEDGSTLRALLEDDAVSVSQNSTTMGKSRMHEVFGQTENDDAANVRERLDWRNNIDLNILPTQSMLLPDAEDKTNEEQSVVGESIIQVSATADATVGWKRRNIITSGPNCIEDRIGRVSVLQQALMKFADRTTDCIINPEVGTEFDDLHEACEYYNLYSWECGFGIPKGKKRYSNNHNRANRKLPDDERYQLGQEFNCRCGGKPGDNLKTTSSRTQCPAMLRLSRTGNHGWVVVAHITEHNHEMSNSYGEKKNSGHHIITWTSIPKIWLGC